MGQEWTSLAPPFLGGPPGLEENSFPPGCGLCYVSSQKEMGCRGGRKKGVGLNFKQSWPLHNPDKVLFPTQPSRPKWGFIVKRRGESHC